MNPSVSNTTGSSSASPMSSGKMAPGTATSSAADMKQPSGLKINMPTSNGTRPASHPSNVLGTTKHAKGQVPGYLKGN